MTTFEIRVKSLRGVLNDFSRTYRALAVGERVSPSAGLYFSSLDAARNLLTSERVRLLALIRRHRPQSVYELAELAGRDLKNTYEDVALLERFGILKRRRRKEGDRLAFVPTVPYDEIRLNIALPGVAEAEGLVAYEPKSGTRRREEARLRHKPSHVRYLFIAESPPLDDDRFFYFEHVTRGDNLFLEVMRVVYPHRFTSAREVRVAKKDFLRRWQGDGFYLLDAVDDPLGALPRRKKAEGIRDHLPLLIKRIGEVVEEGTRLILVSAPVYAACYRPLVEAGFNVVNTEAIDFPGQGRQRRFREKLNRALREAGWAPTA